MQILRSKAQPELIHILLNNREVFEIRSILKKSKSELVKEFKDELKKVLKNERSI